MKISFMTDTGCMRSQNQDAVFASSEPIGSLPNLFLIADGMGGYSAGDYASKKAIDLVKESIAKDLGTDAVPAIQHGITIANETIYQEACADADKAGMGTTMVAATIDGEKMLRVANVGDSRLYIVRDGELQQVTRDHSVIGEMVRKGEMTKEEARNHPKRNLITRAVGAEAKVRVDFFDVDVSDVTAILMCTDGLTTMVDESHILEILTSKDTIDDKTEKLIQNANDGGGKDNITVILIESLD